MKKICIVTATRAEYGILRPLIKKMLLQSWVQLQVVVTGTHLEMDFGYTVQEIEEDKIPIYRKIPILERGDDALAVSRTMANALSEFAVCFQEEQPDMLILLGDRTELLGIAAAAVNARIPIAHLHGGELTQGAVDDCIRHSISKMSYLHFASAEEYRRRIIQMGEEPDRVYNVGALGVENILKEILLSEIEIREDLGIPLEQSYVVVTFHPVTLSEEDELSQIQELFEAMKVRENLYFVITKANADAGGRKINTWMEQEVEKYNNMKFVSSLGMKRYLSAVKYASFVLGNSSSGIIEAPVLKIPTVNIGERQKGRIMADSVIQCKMDRDEILRGIDKALQMDILACKNPYGNGTTSEQIISILKKYLENENINLQKKFYDIVWE